ncbi:MAG TPA: T9SS type A sorting domain-containing protein [Bacteroidales bacterium]|nr:T9SS type A sorting domain-containing protein [Bacteroidales bacterium]
MKKIRFFLPLLLLPAIIYWLLPELSHQNLPIGLLFPQKPEVREPKREPNDWLGKQKVFPHGRFSQEHYLEGLRQAGDLHRRSPRRQIMWEPAGPVNIGGRITDIEAHPLQPETIYVGAASGGIFKSTDNGQSWQHLFEQQPVISIGDIAIDPSNPQVIWAGTGEANSSSFSFVGNGIYRSADGGETWVHKGLDQSAYIGRIVVDYSNSQRVFVAALGSLFTPSQMRGIYRSTDGGDSWQRVLFVSDSTSGSDIVQHPTNPDILYASLWERMRGLTYRRSHGATSGIYKSTDGGQNWVKLTAGLPTGNTPGRIGLAIANNNPEIVYAFIDQLINGQERATVYRSTNGGTSWTRTNDGAIAGMNSNFGWYFGQIRVDPRNDNRFWVLGVDLYRSDNGGQSYTQLAGYYNINDVYVDHHALWVHPVSGLMWHGNDGGLYRSADLGNSWEKINKLPLTQFYTIEVDYLNPHRLYGGTQDNNTIRTWSGAADGWDRILGGDGFYTLVDYTNSNTIYAESQWGNLYRSDNGGFNFSWIGSSWSGERTNWSSPLVMHPTDPQTLYFGTHRVWKTTNKGQTWQAVSADLTRQLATSGFSTISTLAISSLNPNYVLAGTDDGRVHLSTSGGLFWSEVSAGLPLRWITRVAFDPFEANTIYATVSGFRWDEAHPYVFKSVNLGQSWVPIQGNLPLLPVNVIVPDPQRPGWLYVGTDAGIFYTENGGQQWQSLMDGMPMVPVYDLKIHVPTYTLVAGTYGNSAYRLNLGMLTGLGQNLVTNNGHELRLFPNPAQSFSDIQISFSATESGTAEFILIDRQGRLILQTRVNIPRQGEQHYRLADLWRDAVRPGSYLLQVRQGNRLSVSPFIINE